MEEGSRRTSRTAYKPPHRRRRRARAPFVSRFTALILCFALCLSILPGSALSLGVHPCECGHVCGDGTCAYRAASPGVPCDHAHSALCGYEKGSPCTHVCGDGTCVYAPAMEEVPCDHVCAAGEPDADASHSTEEPEPAPVEPVRGHVCQIASFVDYVPGSTLAVTEFDKGHSFEELLTDVLPTSLPVTYGCACAGMEGELPVTWACEDFDPDAVGDYIFTVMALPEYPFIYLAADDPATVDVDESWPPAILVRVYEPAPSIEEFALRYGVINGERVHVRSGPGTVFDTLAEFSADTPVTVTGQCDHWYRVNVADIEGAFIDRSLVTILEEQTGAASPVTGAVNAEDVRIRKGPDRSYDILKTLSIGTPVTILGRSGNWYYVSTEKAGKGYIWREYVTVGKVEEPEEPVCTCTEACRGEAANADCPVCAANGADCAVRYVQAGFPKQGRVNMKNCQVLVGASTLHLALDTSLTLYNEADGRYEFSSAEIQKGFIDTGLVTLDPAISHACTCTSPCDATVCNGLCPVCAAEGYGACAQKSLTQQTLTAGAADGSTVTVSGSLPVGAALSVELVPLETAQTFVTESAQILFAYDIKILVGDVEWQPEEAVLVAVAPPAPIEAPVAVTHVAEDAETGEKTPQPVANVTTTEDGAVEFGAAGFSIYIVTVQNGATLLLTPGAGYKFYSDEECANELPSSYAISEATTIYVQAQNGSVIANVTVTGEDGTVGTGTVTPISAGSKYSIAFGAPVSNTPDQRVIVALVSSVTEVTFDLAQGSVLFTAEAYSGVAGDGTLLTGLHASGNKYTVTQSTSGTPTANTITFSGAAIYNVTLNGINIVANKGTNAHVSCIRIPGVTGTAVTLKLKGNNNIDRLHYYGGGSLTITSADGDGSLNGSLTATSANASDWDAAIGGTDDDDRLGHIYIKGGTITATGRSTAAIGGGGNGSAAITISGGSVTATNSGTGATIGGGGAGTGNGGAGTVTITGGSVSATNSGTGVAIGGGSTNASNAGQDASGGAGNVTISGGTVAATASAGGYGIAIGGGNTGSSPESSTGGTAGTATVSISGGTVTAIGSQGVSGGYKYDTKEYAASTISITGGSYTGNVRGSDSLFTSGGVTYLRTQITLMRENVSVTGAAMSTQVNDVILGGVTDGQGKVYLWLPEGSAVISAVVNGSATYTGNVTAGTPGTLTFRDASNSVVFYLDKGNVTINTVTYSGTDASGNSFSVAAGDVESCTVTQNNSDTANSNTISFSGDGLTATVTLSGINTTAQNSISIPADAEHIKDITLLLDGTNRVKSLYYYTGGDGTTIANGSKLTINNADAENPGTLIANGPDQWQAAIGGTDTNSAVTGLTIAGGNIEATGKDSAAIGGGGNGYAEITITGGNITATSGSGQAFGTGATIGGGGGRSDAGGKGLVTISGGTVRATNNQSGVAIGGGGSQESAGSEGNVIITGGYITAVASTGNAIGGGNTADSAGKSVKGGEAEVTISGGTIKTGHIGGGYSITKGYASSNFTVDGGSINCTTSATPDNSRGQIVYMTRVTLYQGAERKQNAPVTSLGTQGLANYSYGTTDMKTDEDGILYIGLPTASSVHTAVAEGVTFTGDVPANSAGLLSSEPLTTYSIRISPSDRYTLWLDQACSATPFSGIATLVDEPGVTESFSCYLKCPEGDSITAYVPNADTGVMEAVSPAQQPQEVSGTTSPVKIYSFTISNVQKDWAVGLMTERSGQKRLALDLSMGDVVIQRDPNDENKYMVTCGPYSCMDFDGTFYITTSGINSAYSLSVREGSPSIYLDRLNITTSGSGIYISGGSPTVTYSSYDNRIHSASAPAISVSAGATLHLSAETSGTSLTLTSNAVSSIGGAGTVDITKTVGFLNLAAPAESTQITAAAYSYQVAETTTGENAPYTYAPPAGVLVGYHGGAAPSLVAKADARTGGTKWTACTYVGPSDSSPGVIDGKLTVSGLNATPTVLKDGVSYTGGTYSAGTLTIPAADSRGNIAVSSGNQVTGIQIGTLPELTYQYGDKMNLTGITAVLTDSGGATSTIAFDDFSAHGITVSPQHNQILTTEAYHGKYLTVSYGGLTSGMTNSVGESTKLTVMPTVELQGKFEAGYTIRVKTNGQAGSDYQWTYQVEVGGQWVDVPPAQVNGPTCTLSSDMVGKPIRVKVVFSGDIYNEPVTSEAEEVQAPTISATVPLTMTVTVDGTGNCTVEQGSIVNGSAVPLYLTGVAYVRNTAAADYFSDFTAISATLTLDATSYAFTGTTPDPVTASAEIPKDGSLALSWTFALGTGNYIKQAAAADTEVSVATVTYTIGYTQPSP